ncbi:N-acetylmuramoyl-L-alanine amidase CwlA precursor [Slackia heliotrinireducens]|uniref:Negative regulator of beta-lactamase expression n=1 Tax=Slackia heliotrinireducens (strain ATCC 29202 / DSM 20476 / NCTC 11029 / RHS 1) TaxID=471855 RepID=C7N7U1_SLAHD|nr:peptidoglycan-binding domain-containing protein [Slackia heliotrinireducens]ACV22976.1 negative regulator of beta-lactamase expression [Slackia heliotrinireducens DSM 20476]VEH01845.1 N-acetylmuramoyl-L-alanine amidase CwlA precursor [Slackia heliotrinireducens]
METIQRQDSESLKYSLGERLLYLRTPHFQGQDVEQLQTALGALGFACGGASGTFDAYTEGALRKFQLNMGLEPDGIAGLKTYDTLKHLHKAWMDKPTLGSSSYIGFARAADVLEHNAVCLFGTDEYTRMVASYLSNLALATNPRSKMLSADILLVPPDSSMLLTQIVQPTTATEGMPRVSDDDPSSYAIRLEAAIGSAKSQVDGSAPARIAVEVAYPPADGSEDNLNQAAHHEAIRLLDAFCIALSQG